MNRFLLCYSKSNSIFLQQKAFFILHLYYKHQKARFTDLKDKKRAHSPKSIDKNAQAYRQQASLKVIIHIIHKNKP